MQANCVIARLRMRRMKRTPPSALHLPIAATAAAAEQIAISVPRLPTAAAVAARRCRRNGRRGLSVSAAGRPRAACTAAVFAARITACRSVCRSRRGQHNAVLWLRSTQPASAASALSCCLCAGGVRQHTKRFAAAAVCADDRGCSWLACCVLVPCVACG